MMDKVIINGEEFEAIAAITEDEQNTGLMYREWPPPVMFFPYKSAGTRRFWMKNTVSPLDIIFCNEGRIVSIASGVPMSTAMIGPDSPVDLVVEFPKGTAQKNEWGIGDRVKAGYSTESAAKFILTDV